MMIRALLQPTLVFLSLAAGLSGAAPPATTTAPGTLPVPGNLEADGLPPIPRAIFDEVTRYNEFRSAVLLDWHPSERRLLINTRFGEVPQLHQVALPGGDRRQLTFYPDRVMGGAYNPANGDEILLERDIGGGEFFQLYLLDTRNGHSTRLTEGDRSRNTGPHWSRDGKWVAYSSTKRDGEHSDIWMMNPHQPGSAKILLQTNEPGWSIADWSHDGRQLLLELAHSAVWNELYLLDVASGQKRQLGPRDQQSGWRDARFSGDDRRVFLAGNDGSNFWQLQQLDLTTGQASRLRPQLPWDVSEVNVSDDGQYVAYLVNEDGMERLHVMEAATGQDVKLPTLPTGITNAVHWRRNGHEVGFTVTSAHTPGDVYSVEVGSGAAARWTASETGGFDASTFSEPRLIHWRSFDGLTISGFLYPAASNFSGPRPVIVDIHGGPEGQSQPGYLRVNNFYTQEQGVVLIFPNVRGSTGYGKRFLNLDNAEKREDSVRDIGALLDWIKTQPDLDSRRIMITGGSYGGYMTLASMTHYSDRVRCAVEAVGISNFRTFLQHTESYRRDLRRVEYGDERDPKIRDLFDTISPLNNAQKISNPLFIIAGKNDPRVPYTEGVQMKDALRHNNVECWFLMADDEGHGFVKKKNRDFLAAATALFVQQHLLN